MKKFKFPLEDFPFGELSRLLKKYIYLFIRQNQYFQLPSYHWTTARYVQKWKLKRYQYYPTQVCFTKLLYLFCLYDNQCLMFHLLSMTTDKQNYLNLTVLYWYIHKTTPTVLRNKLFMVQLLKLSTLSMYVQYPICLHWWY